MLVAGALGCRDQAPTGPTLPATTAAGSPADPAALEAQVNGLINGLFAPRDQGAVYRDFARIKAALAAGRTDEAQDATVDFVATLLDAWENETLQDPNDGQPPTTAEALHELVNTVAVFGGLPPPLPSSSPFAGDGAVAVVGPEGGTVVTSTGFGGVGFPPGALPEDVIVVVSRLPDPTTPGAGPLPTTLDQYPLFYDFSTSPHVAEFAVPVTVGICQLEVGEEFGPPTQAVADRLRLAHPNPANPSEVEVLERVVASFVNCDGVSLAALPGAGQTLGARVLELFERGRSRLWDLVGPSRAYALHGGLGGKTRSFSPFGAVDPGVIWVGVRAHQANTCALNTTGAAFCWGLNYAGQLGVGSSSGPETCSAFGWSGGCSTKPVPLMGGLTFVAGDLGGLFTCGLTPAGSVHCWGWNGGGVLGAGSFTGPETCFVFGLFEPCSTTPLAVLGGLSFISVNAGEDHACGVVSTGDAYCWGFNHTGALGTGSSTGPEACESGIGCSTTPVPVTGGLTFNMVDGGFSHTCGVAGTGAAYCWGSNQSGQLGIGTNTGPETCATGACSTTPVAVAGGLSFLVVRPGHFHTCSVTPTGAAYCWGGNANGQLGNGSNSSSNVPVAVAGGISFVSVSSGANHSCGITGTGAAYCWGSNFYGQLGNGSTTNSNVPVAVAGGLSFTSLGTGGWHTCGVTTAGAAYCWGRNDAGQLGNSSSANSTVPVAVVSP